LHNQGICGKKGKKKHVRGGGLGGGGNRGVKGFYSTVLQSAREMIGIKRREAPNLPSGGGSTRGHRTKAGGNWTIAKSRRFGRCYNIPIGRERRRRLKGQEIAKRKSPLRPKAKFLS